MEVIVFSIEEIEEGTLHAIEEIESGTLHS
jgi:hypothetical protein